MNLRAKKSLLRRRKNKKDEKNLIIYTVVLSLVLICLFSSVFGAALHFNGQSEKMNKDISMYDLNSYKLQREIQNLKIKLATLSRKENIVSKIRQYRLELNIPGPFQVVHLDIDGTNHYNKTKVVKQLAFNSR